MYQTWMLNDPGFIKSEMKKSKDILDFVDNPHKLWTHLNSNIRNLFFERFVVNKQISRICQNENDFTFKELIQKTMVLNENSKFIRFISAKMSKYQINELKITSADIKHLNHVVKEIFKSWFLEKYNQIIRKDNHNTEEIVEEFVNERIRKTSKIIQYESELDKLADDEDEQTEKRLEKVEDYDNFF